MRELRRLAGIAAVAALLVSGCGSHESASRQFAVQQGVTNGGLTAGAEGTARRIAIREVKKQHINLTAAVALAHERTSAQAEPRSGSCPTGPLIRVVLEGSFPVQDPAVKAEEIYADPLSRHLGICSRTYLSTVPALRSDLGTLYVPGRASTGE